MATIQSGIPLTFGFTNFKDSPVQKKVWEETPRPFENVAHRGAKTLAGIPVFLENTEAALLQAAKSDASVEFDIHAVAGDSVPGDKSKTDTSLLVIHHDDELGRVFQDPLNPNCPVRKLLLSQLDGVKPSLGSVDQEANRLYGSHESYLLDPAVQSQEPNNGNRIPQALPVIKRLLLETNAHLYPEIKTVENGGWAKFVDSTIGRSKRHNYVEKRVLKMMEELVHDPDIQNAGINPYERITVVSFSPYSIRYVKMKNPRIITGLDMPSEPLKLPNFEKMVPAIFKFVRKYLGADLVLPPYGLINPRTVEMARAENLRILPYASKEILNRAQEIELFPHMIQSGVDGIVTNATDAVREEVRKQEWQGQLVLKPHLNTVG